MLHTTPRIRFQSSAGISLVIGMALLTGCAQQQRPVGYYDTPHDTTLADAEQQAQGRRGSRAPSQLQIGFGETGAPKAHKHTPASAAAEPDHAESSASTSMDVRPLLEPKTFLGTVPCVNSDASCGAMRMTLTLAPSGEWRARTVPVAGATDGSAIIQQGCWDVMGNHPLRIILQAQGQESSTGLTFVNDNVLRINMYNDIRPILDYHLTRQADIDPIDELASQPVLNCH